jgi:hypothetical protein
MKLPDDEIWSLAVVGPSVMGESVKKPSCSVVSGG